MLRGELLQRLERLETFTNFKTPAEWGSAIRALRTDIEVDGVLDVQCPPDDAEKLNLSRPVGDSWDRHIAPAHTRKVRA